MLDVHIATPKSASYSVKVATIRWCKGKYMTEDVDYTHNLLLLLLTYHYRLMLTCP